MKNKKCALLTAICGVCWFGPLHAQVLDSLSWSWEVTSSVSTQTKSCQLEFTGTGSVDWGDGVLQPLPDSLSGKVLTHPYATPGIYPCRVVAPAVTYFKADSKRLTALNTEKAAALTYVSCSSNQLVELNASKNAELQSLYCSGNALRRLDASGCVKLQTLTCSDNALTELDLRALKALKKLTAHTNPLTVLRVSGEGALSYVACQNAKLSEAGLNDLFKDLPGLVTLSTSKNLLLLNNPGTTGCNLSVALAKNWNADAELTGCSFYVPETRCVAGDTVSMALCLINPQPVIAFELDVTFPGGFVLDTLRTCLDARRKGKHLLSIAPIRGDTLRYKFMAYSLTPGDVFRGSNGSVLNVYGRVLRTPGQSVVDLEQPVVVDTATLMCLVTVTDGALEVTPNVVRGDVNGDQRVDVTDVVNLVAYINGRSPVAFQADLADLDKNGLWNVADVTRMVLLIGGGATLRACTLENTGTILTEADNKGNCLFLRWSNHASPCLEVCLTERESVQACQVDLLLPEGMTVSTDAVMGNADRLDGHQVQLFPLGASRYRLLLYALRPDKAFRGDTGALVYLPLSVSEQLPDGNYSLALGAPVLTGMDRTSAEVIALPALSFDYQKHVEVSTEVACWTVQGGVCVAMGEGDACAVSDANGRIVASSSAVSAFLPLHAGAYVVHFHTSTGKSVSRKVMVD
jgi:hypothetical protein